MDLELENITHAYGPIEVLNGISLSIPAGRIVCIVGPSGCGKSTLLRLIGGLEKPAVGRVLQVGETPVNSINPLTLCLSAFCVVTVANCRRQHQPGTRGSWPFRGGYNGCCNRRAQADQVA